MVVMAPAGFVALLSGWVVTEVGRQPFTVYGMLRTVDSVSPIDLPGVATSLAAFAIVYLIVFGAGFLFRCAWSASHPSPASPVRRRMSRSAAPESCPGQRAITAHMWRQGSNGQC
jgi:cytochrome d ubiquinol oxidase subunit I